MRLFENLLNIPQNHLIEQAIKEGYIPIGYTCSYVPEVMLSIGKLFPVRVRAPGVAGTEIADTYLSSVICSYARSSLEFFMEGHYDFFGGWVFTASCDHLRRLYDNMVYLKKHPFMHILDVPHKSGKAGKKWLKEELDIFRNAIADHFGVNMDDTALGVAITEYNGLVALLKDIGDMRKCPDPPFTGTEFHHLMLASMIAPPKAAAVLAKQFREELANRKNIQKYRARMMVVGGNLDDPTYTSIIESQGGLVVADRYCTGSIPHLTTISNNRDPLSAITEHTFARTDCPRMMADFDGRIKRIMDAIRDYHVDGIVLEAIKFCDTWGAESSPLVSTLREAGVPVLRIEREYHLGGEGQLKTRVQAFIESMGK
jgi:benzoyl-CoA reductase/2-hydroxyglutaryl-CoA dehydratase subunit BcrC/BadD/HgdB